MARSMDSLTRAAGSSASLLAKGLVCPAADATRGNRKDDDVDSPSPSPNPNMDARRSLRSTCCWLVEYNSVDAGHRWSSCVCVDCVVGGTKPRTKVVCRSKDVNANNVTYRYREGTFIS